MEIIIRGEAKEIAALAPELQRPQAADDFGAAVKRALESARRYFAEHSEEEVKETADLAEELRQMLCAASWEKGVTAENIFGETIGRTVEAARRFLDEHTHAETEADPA